MLRTACDALLAIFIHGGFSKSSSGHGKAASVPMHVTVMVITQWNGWGMVAGERRTSVQNGAARRA
jgi:hypothetical protein